MSVHYRHANIKFILTPHINFYRHKLLKYARTCNLFLSILGRDLSSLTSSTIFLTSVPNVLSSSSNEVSVSSTVSCRTAAYSHISSIIMYNILYYYCTVLYSCSTIKLLGKFSRLVVCTIILCIYIPTYISRGHGLAHSLIFFFV